MSVKLEHPSKANSPITDTELGKSILVNSMLLGLLLLFLLVHYNVLYMF